MHLFRLLLTLLAVSTQPAPAPAPHYDGFDKESVLNCGADQLHEALRKSDTEYALKMDRLETKWASTSSEDRSKSAAAPPYVLPIVFHIVHENGPENIPDADVLRSVDFLNQALENTGYYDPATGVNTQIQVCLASRSPDNELTNGINRIISPLTNLNTNEDRDMKDLSRWAPRDYINVWVVKQACGLGLGCGLAGYSTYPSAHGSSIDGIVMEARWLTDDEADLTVLVHELGHYLGLRHTFSGSCENDDCLTDGDRVCDTPPDQSTVAVPCTGSANSCSTDTDSGPFASDQDDMHINYMDYGFFRCYSAFTAGQRERMHFFLEGTRRSLVESRGCEEPCPAVATASFTGGDVTVQAGETVNFTNTSTNGDRYEWYRGSTLIGTDENLSYQFDEEGSFRIRLIVFPADNILCASREESQRVNVTCHVTASFNIPFSAPLQDSTVVFTNTSSGGNESEWTVDGSVVSSSQDLSFSFTASGSYRVCLTEALNLCEDERCIIIFVRPPVTNPGDGGEPPLDTLGCNGRFSYSYWLPGGGTVDGAFGAIVARGDTVYTLAQHDRKPYVMALTSTGTILWQTELFPSITFNTPHRLFLDNSGMLVGIFNPPEDEAGYPLIFRIAPESGSILWAKEFRSEIRMTFTGIIHSTIDGSYKISGILRGLGLELQLDPSNGNIASSPQVISNFGSVLIRDLTEISGISSSSLAMVANVDQGIILIQTTGAGEVLSTNLVSTVSNAGAVSSFQNALMEEDVDSLIIGADIRGFTENPTSFRICKTGFSGTPRWTKDYQLPVSESKLLSIQKNNIGYLLLLDLGIGTGLLQMDKNGEVLWSYLYDNFHTHFSGPDALVVEDNHILFTGFRSNAEASFPTVVRLSKDGTPLTSCIPATSLNITAQSVENTNAPYQISNTPIQLGSQDFGAEPSTLELLEELTCREDCPEDNEEDCARPFVRAYGPTDFAPNLAPYEVNFHVEHGDNLIIAGRNEAKIPFVAVLGPQGEIFGTRSIIIDQPGVIRDMIIDAEGLVCGVGTAGASANGGLSTYAFRFDPGDGIVSWVKNYGRQDRSFVLSELHHTPGDSFLRAAGYREDDPLSAVSNNLLARIDLATGDILVPPLTYIDPGETSFRAFDKHPGSNTYFALASIQQSAAGTPQVARLNANGTVIYNKQYDGAAIGQAIDMAVTDTTITILCERNNGNGFVLIQTDTNGNELWQKSYLNGNEIHGITSLPDGMLVWITSSPDNNNALVKLDQEGNVLWANSISTSFNVGLQRVFHVSASTTTLTISTVSGFNTLESSFGIIRTDLSGTFSFDCIAEDAPIEVPTSVNQTIVADVPLQLGQTSFFTEDLNYEEVDLELKENCTGDCIEPEEICYNNLDDDGDGLVDCNDPDLVNDCCCLDPPIIEMSILTALCDGSFFTIRTGPTVNWERLTLTVNGTEQDIELESVRFRNFEEPGNYIFQVTDTCGRTGADTFILAPYLPPVLELSPDTTVCANATVNLLAQPGFTTYEWNDGSTEETFTTFGEGDFWVVVTDSCGSQQTDTVTVTYNDETIINLGEDQTICPGDTLSFRLDGYTDIQWSQSSFIDCFDCPEVRFAPTMDTLLLVAAMQGEGCFSSDSLRVRIKALNGIRDTAFLCPGDSVLFGEQNITTPGQYYDVTDESRCPVVDTLDVIGLPDTLISATLSICDGDSTLVFGTFERVAGTYTDFATRANGCDSINELILTVIEPVVTSETISICAGDSALIFGIFERVADLYSATETGSNGCDSTHQIMLEVNDVSASAIQIMPDCGGAGAGAGQVLVESSDGPVSIRWSDNTTTALNENLIVGDYSVTVTTADGCSDIATLTITDAPTTNLAPAAAPETCPGENDGSISDPTNLLLKIPLVAPKPLTFPSMLRVPYYSSYHGI